MLCTTIIPTINRPTLALTVKSALEQDLGSGQHEILIFNNSKQRLPEFDWLMSSKITIVNTYSDLYDASNKGAEMASGKYINFVHDDDFLLPGGLKALVELAESTGCYWISGAYNLIDDDGNIISLIRQDIKGNILAFLIGGECLHLSASLINREAYLKVGGLDPQIPVFADLNLECQLALLSNYDYTDQIVANVRVSGGKASSIEWTSTTQDHRKLREKALSSPISFVRMEDSVRSDVFLRGRACRVYLFSAVLNILGGHLVVARGRVASLLRLAGFYPFLPNFWRGLFFRTSWHANGKREQEEYFKKMQRHTLKA